MPAQLFEVRVWVIDRQYSDQCLVRWNGTYYLVHADDIRADSDGFYVLIEKLTIHNKR